MSSKPFWFSSNGLVALAFIAAVTYFLLVEHREHLFQALPYLILLLCPLMHLFVHRGHGGHHHHRDPDSDLDNETYRRGFEEGRRQARDRHNDS